jgi:hypothetical protein
MRGHRFRHDCSQHPGMRRKCYLRREKRHIPNNWIDHKSGHVDTSPEAFVNKLNNTEDAASVEAWSATRLSEP